jgi:type I restriction enzyme S subunit
MGEEATFSQLMARGLLAIGDGYRAKNKELGGEGPVFLRAAYLQDSGFVADTPERFRELDRSKFGDKVARLGDVVVTTKGNSTGRIGVIRSAQAGAVYSPHLSYWRSLDHGSLDQQFLYYWSQSQEFRLQLRGMAYSTDMAPYFSLRDQNRLRITLLGVEQQRAIGQILGALDDKIELNRRMNATLEAMAQAIFRDWFVDFGPTRRKLDGTTDPVAILGGLVQDPTRAAELTAMFPAAFANGLPEGWEERPIGEMSEIVGGSTPSTQCTEYWKNGVHHWATPKDLSQNSGLYLFKTERCITAQGLANISSGLSPARSVLLSSRAPIGYLAIADAPMAVNQGFIVMRPSPLFPPEFAFLWCREKMELIKANANGSTFQEISKRNFRPLGVIAPPRGVMQAFAALAGDVFGLIRNNELQNRTLAATRDLLLPKLMSGEIRLREAEAMAEAAQ